MVNLDPNRKKFQVPCIVAGCTEAATSSLLDLSEDDRGKFRWRLLCSLDKDQDIPDDSSVCSTHHKIHLRTFKANKRCADPLDLHHCAPQVRPRGVKEVPVEMSSALYPDVKVPPGKKVCQ